MAKTQILEFTVWLRDAAKVSAVQQALATNTQTPGPPAGLIPGDTLTYSIAGGTPRKMWKAPYYAGIEFDVYMGGTGANPLPQIEIGQTPPLTGFGYITSAWFTSTNSFPRTTRKFSKSTGWWIFGSTTDFYWGGYVALAPGVPVVVGTPENLLPAAKLKQRFFLHGYEQLHAGETGVVVGAGGMPARTTPGASRTGDGLGLRMARHLVAGTKLIRYDLTTLHPPVTDAHDLWTRFYMRPLRYGSTVQAFFQALDATGFTPGFVLGLTATGQLALYRNGGFPDYALTLISTFGSVPLHVWSRIEVICHGITTGSSLDVLINGVQVGAGATSTAPGVARAWKEMILGHLRDDTSGTLVTTDAEIDFDDWMAAPAPLTRSGDGTVPAWNSGTVYAIGAVVRHAGWTYSAKVAGSGHEPSSTGTDNEFWLLVGDSQELGLGSHLVRVAPNGFGPAHDASWVGDYRMLQRVYAGDSMPWGLKSPTALALCEVTLPLATAVDQHPASRGIVAWHVMARLTRHGTDSGRLGYQVGAETPVMVDVESHEIAGDRYVVVTGTSQTGQPLPKGTPITLRYENATDAGANTQLNALSVVVELQGTFGPEDVAPVPVTVPPTTPPPVPAFPTDTPVHLRHWPSTPWARDGMPMGPVQIYGGIYVGTGTAQDFLFALPPCWITIRELNVPTSGHVTRWWPSLLTAQSDFDGLIDAQAQTLHHSRDFTYVPASPDADQQMQFSMQMAGTSRHNQVGITYQLCALFDPGMRFSLAWGTANRPAVVDVPGMPKVWNIGNAAFHPEVAFLYGETVVESAQSALPLLWKLPGHAVDAVSTFTGTTTSTLLPDALTFGDGTVTVRDDLVTVDRVENFGFVFFRRSDGNDGSDKVLFYGTYVGDGAGSRTINLSAVTGNRPLYAVVGPESGGGKQYHRDPSHLANTSSGAGSDTGTPATTAITAGGIDSFTVGIALNATSITYHYWGLYGGPVACEGGWSCNGTFTPVPTDTPTPPGWVPPVEWPTTPPGTTPPGTTPPGLPPCGDDCAEGCVEYSGYLANQALSSIGITDHIVTFGTDRSRNADTALLHYRAEIDAVLRAYPWKFATRYATLLLVEGDPLEPDDPDWTYRYALPADCLFVRRIVPLPPAVMSTPRPFNPAPIPFAYVESDASLPFLVTNQAPEVKIEYTARPPCPARVRDPIYKRACVWRLAHAFAAPLGRDKAQVDSCYQLYLAQITEAQARDTNEQQPEKPSGRYLDPGGLLTDGLSGCVEYSTYLCNLALSSIGQTATITSLGTDPSGPAMLARLHYKAEVDSVLRAHPWKFATRYATLSNIYDEPVAVPDPLLPPPAYEPLQHPDWAHQYVLPSDCLLVRRIVPYLPSTAEEVVTDGYPNVSRQFDAAPVPFDYVESGDNVAFLLANAAPVTIEYTARIACPARVQDPLFIRACTWRLAHAFGPALKVEQPAIDKAYQLYQLQLEEARSRDQNQQQPQNPVHIGEAEWIRGRQ